MQIYPQHCHCKPTQFVNFKLILKLEPCGHLFCYHCLPNWFSKILFCSTDGMKIESIALCDTESRVYNSLSIELISHRDIIDIFNDQWIKSMKSILETHHTTLSSIRINFKSMIQFVNDQIIDIEKTEKATLNTTDCFMTRKKGGFLEQIHKSIDEHHNETVNVEKSLQLMAIDIDNLIVGCSFYKDLDQCQFRIVVKQMRKKLLFFQTISKESISLVTTIKSIQNNLVNICIHLINDKIYNKVNKMKLNIKKLKENNRMIKMHLKIMEKKIQKL